MSENKTGRTDNVGSSKKKPQKKATYSNLTSVKLQLMVTVVNRNKAEFYTDLIQTFGVNMQFTALGSGTADAKMLDYLGLAVSEKAVIFSVIREDKARSALEVLENKFQTIKNGKGIAYTVSLTSLIGVSAFRFLSDNRMTVKEK